VAAPPSDLEIHTHILSRLQNLQDLGEHLYRIVLLSATNKVRDVRLILRNLFVMCACFLTFLFCFFVY
jgi:hypothetical protein